MGRCSSVDVGLTVRRRWTLSPFTTDFNVWTQIHTQAYGLIGVLGDFVEGALIKLLR